MDLHTKNDLKVHVTTSIAAILNTNQGYELTITRGPNDQLPAHNEYIYFQN